MSNRSSGRVVERGSARRGRGCLAVLAAFALLVAAGCNEGEPEAGKEATEVRLYGSDGNMNGSFGNTFRDHASLLNGMRGTSPLTPLPEDFKQRLRGLDQRLTNDFLYAAEAYDAVMIAALAAETARTVDPPQIARFMTSVTVTKDSVNGVCETARSCLDAVRAGRDIAYRGISIRRSGLTDGGEPSSASYGTLTFNRSNALDDAKTEFVPAGDERNEAKELPTPPAPGSRPRNTTPLRIGALLPKTGDLAIAGPPIFAGVQLAINELNGVGGVLGLPVTYLDGDDGTDPKVAAAQVDRFITQGAHVIVGAGASGITKAVIPKIVQAQRVLISPSATSDELTKEADNGLFFRTSPPDNLQSKALTDVIMRYGAQQVVIVARDDSYGVGLGEKVADQLRAAGVKPDRLKMLRYEVRKEYSVDQFTALATETINFRPDSVLVIGFEESGNVIKALSARGMKFRS